MRHDGHTFEQVRYFLDRRTETVLDLCSEKEVGTGLNL